MAGATTIALKDLRQRLRDRSAIVLAVVAPVAIALILSFALTGSDVFTPTYALVDLDEGPIGGQLVAGLTAASEEEDARLQVVAATDEEDAEQRLRDAEVNAAIIVPATFSADVAAGRRPTLRVLTEASRPVAAAVARGIAEGFIASVDTTRLAVLATIDLGELTPDPATAAAIAERAAGLEIAIGVDQAAVRSTGAGPSSYYAPAMAVFFLFFTVQFGARSLLAERQAGTLARLLAAPMRPASIIAGKALGSFVLGVVSLAVIVAITTLALDAQWGDLVGVAVMGVAVVIAAMGVTALVITLARTPEQADGYGSAIAIVLALLGGNFIALSQAPDVLQTLSLLTPNGWAIRGFGDLAFDGVGTGGILPEAGAAALFGAVTGGLALLRARNIVRIR